MDAPVHASSSSSGFERVIGCGHVSGLLCGEYDRWPVWSYADLVQNQLYELGGSLTRMPYQTHSHRSLSLPFADLLIRRRSVLAASFIRKGDRNEHARLARQHACQPRILGRGLPACPANYGHCTDDQKPPYVALPHFRRSSKDLLSTARMLFLQQTEPGRKISPPSECSHCGRECLDRHCVDGSHAGHGHQASGTL
jgi:hypothetical protein